MGQVNVPTASGQGSISLGGAQAVNEYLAHLITPGDETNFYGQAGVRRTFQLGWVGLSEHLTSPWTADAIVWKTFIENETEDKLVVYASGNNPDTFWWDLDPGAVVDLYVYWP